MGATTGTGVLDPSRVPLLGYSKEQILAILGGMITQAAHDATLYCADAKRTLMLPCDNI